MKKYNYLYTFILFFIILGTGYTLQRITGVKTFNAHNLSLHNIDAKKDPAGNEVFTVSDMTYEKNNSPFITDLILSFNKPSFQKNMDDSRHYDIAYASYKHIKGNKSIGGGAALFYKQEHRLELAAKKKLWLSNASDLGSFSIEFRVYPLSFNQEGIIFSRVGYLSGERNGIEIVLQKNRIVAKLYGVFKNENGRRIDYQLSKETKLKKGRWYHYLLSFSRISGKLSHYIDEKEQDTIYITESGAPYNGVLAPSFASVDLPPIVLGKNCYLYLDEFRITFRRYEDLARVADIAARHYRQLQLNGRVPINKEGVITSPVYNFDLTGTMITHFKWHENLKKNTFIWMEFRISDAPFASSAFNVPWYRITNNQRNIYLKKVGGFYLRGKYYQWRAHLVPSPEGNNSPAISDITLNYEYDPSPAVPMFMTVKNIGNKKIILSWKKNVDYDLYGYKIYYGVQSGQYEGVIQYINSKIISNKLTNNNYITIVLDNRIIEENRFNNKTGMLDYPILKNNVLYFFAVSAYDSYKPGTIFNHESALSNEVTARPFAGSEIK